MLTKYAVLDLLSAEIAPRNKGALRRFAHRHNFDYDPRPGYLYVRSRAISSRTNDNFDEFPAEEILKSYRTFIGKPVFVNHRNENHRRARGVVIDAALHQDRNPDGSPDTWAEVLMEIDAVHFPKLAQAILAGEIDKTSMGTDVAYSVCSFCGNKASTPLEYCKHIPRMKGKKIRRTLASGAVEDVLVRERCYGLKFFENSVLVEDPADPTAFFLGIDGMNMATTATRFPGTVTTTPGSASTNNINGTALTFSVPRDMAKVATVLPPGVATKAYVDKVARRSDTDHSVAGRATRAARVDNQHFPPVEYYRRLRARRQKRALNDIVAPAEVDTLREDTCPVCGEKDTYDGNKCRVCGFIKPPDIFMDPDLDVAQQTDLRQDNQDVADALSMPNDLLCDNCGASFSSAGGEEMGPEVEDTTEPVKTGPSQQPAEIVNQPPEVKVPQTNALPKPKKQQPPDQAAPQEQAAPKDQSDKQLPDEQDDKQPPDDKQPKPPVDKDEDQDASVKAKEGDTCPTCGQGTLQIVNTDLDPSTLHVEEVPDDDADASAQGDAEQDDSKNQDEEKDEDDKDGKGKSKPPWLKDKKKSSLSNIERGHRNGERAYRRSGVDMARPALQALAAQQRLINSQATEIESLREGVKFIAELAGVADHPRVAALFKKADENNPAQPIPTPGAEGPAQTTDDALAPAGTDDVESIGASPVDGTAADATTAVDAEYQTVADEPLDLNEEDVTKPVEGTTEQRPLNETKIETDVRVGNPNNPEVAFPLEGDFAQKATTGATKEARTFASLRLARLRIAMGIADGDDLVVASEIDGSDLSDGSIQAEIDTLSKVRAASKKTTASAPRNLVPRTAARGVERLTPSLVEQEPTLPVQSVVEGPSSEEFLFD